MNSNVVITTVLIPGFVSVLLFLVFSYLYEQSRQPYFLAWKWAWACIRCTTCSTLFRLPPLRFL